MTIDNDLSRALRRKSPPDGFAGRVLQRIAEEEGGGEVRARTSVSPKRWWRTAAASLTLGLLLGGYATHRAVEHRRGEAAREQVLAAMRIAGEKVRYAQQEVRQIGTND